MTTPGTTPPQAAAAAGGLNAPQTRARFEGIPSKPPRRDLVESGVIEGPLFIALPRVSRSGHPVTEMLIKGQWVSAWGHRTDLLSDVMQDAVIQVPWKRLDGRASLYLDGDVTVLRPASGQPRQPPAEHPAP